MRQIGLDPNFTISMIARISAEPDEFWSRHNLASRKTESRFQPGQHSRHLIRAPLFGIAARCVVASSFPWCAGWGSSCASCSRAYVETKQEHNVLDYDDLLPLLGAGVSEPQLAERHRGGAMGFMCLVDEYQDTNRCSSSILLDPQARRPRLNVVGDDAQVDLFVSRRERSQHPRFP